MAIAGSVRPRRWRVAMSLMLALLCPPASGLQFGMPRDAYPGAAAAYILVADGRPVWAREVATPHQPASLAKLLTALVLLDADWQPDAPVTVSTRAAAIEGSRLGLRSGETLRAGDAFTAMLVRSANDACVVLAEHAAGSLEAFADLMNERAAALGMGDSHFVHPCGLDAPGQQSSVRDLLRLAIAAMDQPAIAAVVALREAAITTAAGRRLSVRSTNLLLDMVEGTIGIKTGYTSRAGKCLIALARRGDHSVWLVMLDAPLRWDVAGGMMERAFREISLAERMR